MCVYSMCIDSVCELWLNAFDSSEVGGLFLEVGIGAVHMLPPPDTTSLGLG